LALVLVFFLASVYLTDKRARELFKYFVMGAAFTLVFVCIWRLWASGDPSALFSENRFYYPTTYPNGAAALFLISFWPLMWITSAPRYRAPVRGAALGLATALLGLTIMTQSRGAMYSFAASLVVMFIISPIRLRTLLYLLVPCLMMFYEFPKLNRYWTHGPAIVGGGAGARAITVAAITAAAIGVVIALLERWIPATRRMKVIFGTVVIACVVAGAVYGATTLTRDSGGVFGWFDKSWNQFTSDTGTTTVSNGATSRFADVSSGGRIDMWRVAWNEFKSSPILGKGADNYVFDYERLRTAANLKPKQAHSIELQILGETGLVGGLLAFGAVVLAFGALMWGRIVAGRRREGRKWRIFPAAKNSTDSGRLDKRLRWGSDPTDYGWEMAIVAALTYWLLHASVDWLWQLTAVAMPPLLFVAAGLAGVEGRVDVIWPRLNVWLKHSSDEPEPQMEANETDHEQTPDSDAVPVESSSLYFAARRTEKYESRRHRADRRHSRKLDNLSLLRPPGALSSIVRWAILAVSLGVIVAAGLSYLSLQLQTSALGLEGKNNLAALSRAQAASHLLPADSGPSETKYDIYLSAAATAAASSAPGKAGAVLDDLALAIASARKAVDIEPADWSLQSQAGVATLNLLLASQYAGGHSPQVDLKSLSTPVTGLRDWSGLASTTTTQTPAGSAAGSLAVSASDKKLASTYRNMSTSDLAKLASAFFAAAKERNPLETEWQNGLAVLRAIGVGTLNVKDFGAKGDGQADDTQAIQKTIDRASSNGGGEVFLPKGTYKTTAELVISSGGITLKGEGSGSAIKFTSPQRPEVGISIQGDKVLESVEISDLALVGNYDKWDQQGISISGLDNGRFANLTISDIGFCGIFAFSTSNTIIDGISVTHCGDFGVQFKQSSKNVTVKNSKFDGFQSRQYPGHAIYFEGTENAVADNNHIANLPSGSGDEISGIKYSGSSGECTNNTVEDSYGGISTPGAHDVRIAGNTIRRISQRAIYVLAGAKNITIENNTIENALRAIQLNAYDTWPTGVRIVNNKAQADIFVDLSGGPQSMISEMSGNSWQGTTTTTKK
jgi:hypothetical protein